MIFEIDEIVVFDSVMRQQVYISRILQVHLDYPAMGPQITKASIDQKKAWYENDNYELVIED